MSPRPCPAGLVCSEYPAATRLYTFYPFLRRDREDSRDRLAGLHAKMVSPGSGTIAWTGGCEPGRKMRLPTADSGITAAAEQGGAS